MLRTLFFGTPHIAVPPLEAMTAAGYRPLRVISQPSRPVGRGRRIEPPPVAAWALEHGLELRQPESVRDEDFLAELEELAPDVAVVVAFGQIFRQALLDLPRHGCLNLHASLLPKYRGAAPIQAAIAHGDPLTGVTVMRMERGLDSGPMLLRREMPIGPDETSPELAERIAALGGEMLVEALGALERGGLQETPQDDALATYAPRIEKSDGAVDWHLEARRIYDRLRAFTPWPGLSSELGGRPLKIVAARPVDGEPPSGEPTDVPPGTFLGLREDGRGEAGIAVACGGGTMLCLTRVQRPGKKAVSAADFLRGERLETGERFAPPPA